MSNRCKPVGLVAGLFLSLHVIPAVLPGDTAVFPAGTVLDRFSGAVIRTSDLTGFKPVSPGMVGHAISVGGQSMIIAPCMSFKMGKGPEEVPDHMYPNPEGEYIVAILKVTDQVRLKRWGAMEPQAAIRQAAVAGIEDDRFLLERLPLEQSGSVRIAIISTLHERISLRQVALTAFRAVDRDHACRRFDPSDQDILAARESLADQVRSLADETDCRTLLQTALKAEFDVLRCAAARRLTNTVSLESLARETRDREVQRIVLARLDDKPALDRIANAPVAESAMRLACAQKIWATTWDAIFASATARHATAQNLGDAIAAVLLHLAVPPEVKSAAQQACLNLIRLGDETRIPEMVDLLESYGDKALAEDYLNCGQPDLIESGHLWGAKRGYDVGLGDGSDRAQWGGQR
jgi:hypothetical protein